MPRATTSISFKPMALMFALALGTTNTNADYQQTLAAQGADAYTAPEVDVTIDNKALAETFQNNIVEVNPALSDQEVMIDLHARMLAEQRLEAAAAALDPTSVSAVIAEDTAPDNTPDTEASDTEASDAETTATEIASR